MYTKQDFLAGKPFVYRINEYKPNANCIECTLTGAVKSNISMVTENGFHYTAICMGQTIHGFIAFSECKHKNGTGLYEQWKERLAVKGVMP